MVVDLRDVLSLRLPRLVMASVVLKREGFDPIEIQVSQLTPAAVSSLFSVS